MNELQAEKKAIQTALESIRAHDARSPDPSSDPSQRRIATPGQNRSPVASQTPFQTTLPDLQASIHTAIQTALQSNSAMNTEANEANNTEFDFEVNRLYRSPQSFPSEISRPQAETRTPLQPLEAQANPINQPSQNQETAFRRLQSIAAQIEEERCKAEQAKQLTEKFSKKPSAKGDCPRKLLLPLEQPVSASQVESPAPIKPVTLRINVPGDATDRGYEIAQLLRQLQESREDDYREYQEQLIPIRKSRRRSPLLKRFKRWLYSSSFNRSSHHSSSHPLSHRQSSRRRAAAPAEMSSFTLRETLTLLLGAALTRLLLDLLLQAMPLLAIPVMILLLVPAAIAVHRTTTQPQSGILWGYRLCIILLGLLIGGRL